MKWTKIDELATTENKTEQMPCSELGSEPLKRTKQELFVQEFIKEGSNRGDAVKAYFAAGFKAKNNEVAASASSRLLKNVNVRDRLSWLQKKVASDICMKQVASKQELAEYYTKIVRQDTESVSEQKVGLEAARSLASLMGYETTSEDQMPASLKEFLDGIAKDCMKLPSESEDLPPSPFKAVRLKIAGGE